MKDNANTILVGQNVILVPYKPEHVPKYHEWMKDPYLQETTASEPLTLEEEYEMQKSWAEDRDKCTFIILERPTDIQLTSINIKQHARMIGDVNLFLTNGEDPSIGELEIMIAEKSMQRMGLATQTLFLFMNYIVTDLKLTIPLTRFSVKIGKRNIASVALFTQKLGFTQVAYSEIFDEVELALDLTQEIKFHLRARGTPEQVLQWNE